MARRVPWISGKGGGGNGSFTGLFSTCASRTALLDTGKAVIVSLSAYYVVDEWPISFTYRTSINPLIFIAAAGIAFVVFALQSFRTARANPVFALRYE